jgi:hypothetical protein
MTFITRLRTWWRRRTQLATMTRLDALRLLLRKDAAA